VFRHKPTARKRPLRTLCDRFKVAGMKFTRSATTTAVRVYLLAAIGSVLGLILAVALFLVALFSHHNGFFTAAEVALIASMLSTATTATWRAYTFSHSKRWTLLDGRAATRDKQPWRFAIWLTLHGVLAAVWWSAAVFLIWSLFLSKH
jgi:hypothetical protein